MSFLDVMGISLGKKRGLLFAIISGEDSPFLDRFAKKMDIVDVYKGCKDKAAALRDFARKHYLDLEQVCFVGDDVNDVPALELAGLAVVPATAHADARSRAGLVTKAVGGQGAVREVVDMILAKQRS